MIDNIKVRVLGSVSPYCKGNNNCPGFLIEYGKKKIMLDCGNGITRFLNLPKDLENLIIIITHLHKNHYGDLAILQYASYVYHNLGLLDKPVEVYLPKDEFSSSLSTIKDNKESFAIYKEINDEIEIEDLFVKFYDNKSHTIPSYVVTIMNKLFKIVYTSDVGSNNLEGLIKVCQDADLLICESSFIKDHNSSIKTHLCAYEAALIARRAHVKQLMLTHFWPETEKKLYLNEARIKFDKTVVAEEGKSMVLRK